MCRAQRGAAEATLQGHEQRQEVEAVTADLLDLIGQTIRIYLGDTETSGSNYYCGMYADDVSLQEQ